VTESTVTDIATTPAAEPLKDEHDRTITATWTVGEADDEGWRPQARLVVSHYPQAKCFHAKLQPVRQKREDGFVSEMLNYNALTYAELIRTQPTNRFSRTTLNTVYHDALDELRTRFANGDVAVTPYFDPTSDRHAV